MREHKTHRMQNQEFINRITTNQSASTQQRNNKKKTQSSEWKKVFVSHPRDRGLMSVTYQ